MKKLPEPEMGKLSGAIAKGLEGIKQNIIPAAIIWVIGIFFIYSYYYTRTGFEVFSKVETVKLKYGFLFSLISTSVCGGLLPFLFELLFRETRKKAKLSNLIFYSAFWAFRGVDIDLFYHLQAYLFGAAKDFSTVVSKVVFDQFGYSMIYAVPMVIIIFSWKDQGYPSPGKYKFQKDFWSDQFLPVMIFNIVIWLPTVIMLYNFPLALQLPIQNLVLTFYSLLLVFLVKPKEAQKK